MVARGASGRWSHGSAKKISDGFSESVRFNRIYLFRDRPSTFQVNIFRFVLGDIASDSWSDKSEESSLKERILAIQMVFLERVSQGQLLSARNVQVQQNQKI